MKVEIEKIKEIALHIFFPNRCISCGHAIEVFLYVCSDCEDKLPFINKTDCLICGKEECDCDGFFFDGLYTPFYYEMGIQRAIIELKFNDGLHIANKLGYYMSEYIKSFDIFDNIDFLVPVPMHKSDFIKRGYNQAVEIARVISKRTNIKLIDHSLYKINKTKEQHKSSHQDRHTNLLNAFSVKNSDIMRGKTILLIDDVFTTGATVNNCARVIKSAGVKKVYALTACKTNYGKEFDKI